jgi:hypothetical protein
MTPSKASLTLMVPMDTITITTMTMTTVHLRMVEVTHTVDTVIPTDR